ncbi:MAG: RNA polymerase sigma-70 factor [Gemmatimonadaceae bacterium]
MTAPQRLPYHGPEWIERIRSGDERAFEALFRALAPGLCALSARYVGSRQVAEELVQELFLDLWTHRAELRVEQALTAYLFAATRNRALNHVKRERRMVRWDVAGNERPDDADPGAPNESELLDALELQHAVETLPARCRLIFTLNRQQEMTYSEIAASLGLSIKTVETQMGRALKALRERLKHLVE